MMLLTADSNIAPELGGATFTPGTYRSLAAITATASTIVNLNGNGETNPVFIFIATSTITIGAHVRFNLSNGARVENVFWVLGTAANVGESAILPGSILAGSTINIGKEAKLEGCALAQTAVTFADAGHATSGKY
jgi:hypothetical protein